MSTTTGPIPPAEVVSPKRHWSLIAILKEANEDGSSLAIGRSDGKPVLAMRWTGDEQNRIGNRMIFTDTAKDASLPEI